ncbi:MAG: hypothetical protein PHN59_07335, partial [Candidatus Omnitrophica bacterium]|nr:hypothetical protein [Candidatus Omnitrophota bacterium]
MEEAGVFASDSEIESDAARGQVEDFVATLNDASYVGAEEIIYTINIAVAWWTQISVLALGIISFFLGLVYWFVRPVSQATGEKMAVAIRSMGHTPGTLVMDDLRDAGNALENLDEQFRSLPTVKNARKKIALLVGLPALHTAINPATGKRYQKAGRLHRLWTEAREVTQEQQRLPRRYEAIRWLSMLLLTKYEVGRERKKIRKLLVRGKVEAGSRRRLLLRRAYGLVKYAEDILSNRIELFLGKQKPEVVELATLLKLIRQAVAYKFGDKFQIEVCDGLAPCMVVIPSRAEFKNAIANCLENGTKAIFKTLTLAELSSMDADNQLDFERENMAIAVRRSGNSLSVSVIDKGVGIPSEQIKKRPDGRYPICELNVSSEGQSHGLGMTEVELAVGRKNLEISSLTIDDLVESGFLPIHKAVLGQIAHRVFLSPALRTFIRDMRNELENLAHTFVHNIDPMGRILGVSGTAEVKNLPRDILKFRHVMGRILGGMHDYLTALDIIDDVQVTLTEYVLEVLDGCYQQLGNTTQHANTVKNIPQLGSDDYLQAFAVYKRFLGLLEILRRLDSGERVSVGTNVTLNLPIVAQEAEFVRTYPLVVPNSVQRRMVRRFNGERDLAKVRFYKNSNSDWQYEIQWRYATFSLAELNRLLGLIKNNLSRAPPEDGKEEFFMFVTTKSKELSESNNSDNQNIYFGTTRQKDNRINIHPWAIELVREIHGQPAIKLLFQDFLRHELEELETGSHLKACLKSIRYFSEPKNHKKLKALLEFFKMRNLTLSPIYMSQLLKIAMEDNCATRVLAEATKNVQVDYPRTAEKLVDRIQAGVLFPQLTLKDVIFTENGVLADLSKVLFAVMEQFVNSYTGIVLNSDFDAQNSVLRIQIFAYQETSVIEIRRQRDNV